ncbi:MAG: hypothetical protein IJ616_09040 [Bacteroidales bacterium]|nr:hypothetical protein [Bacteroidales bacterium]
MDNKDTPFKDGKGPPNYTNQAMNRDIKELCRLAGIDEEIRVTTYKGNVRTDKIKPKWKLVGTHTGRRTYIDIVDSIKASSMAKFDGLI